MLPKRILPILPGTKYSEWVPVPEDRTTLVKDIVEGKKFQIRTDKKIDEINEIKWRMKGVDSNFVIHRGKIYARYCHKGYKSFSGDEGFYHGAGVLTFLKTTTQLQIWFDDVLEVTWVYEDDIDKECRMRNHLAGISFKIAKKGEGAHDTVSTHYRYELGNLIFPNIYMSIS